MQIEFVDLARQNKLLFRNYSKIIAGVVKEANFIAGSEVNVFESTFAAFCGKKYAVGVNSGTDALLLSLIAYGIGRGDEVITAPNTFFATVEAIHATGAKVIFADIDPATYTLNPQQVAKKVTSRTRAIIPIHLFGQPTDMDPLLLLAQKYHLKIIEDCCQAHGARYKGKLVPYSETGAFSFYPSKNLGGFGDGGMVITNNALIAAKVRRFRNHGASQKYTHEVFGFNSRLDTLQAAILNFKLKHLVNWNRLRQKHSLFYIELLQQLTQLQLPKPADFTTHVYHIFAITTPHRHQLQKFLRSRGIATGIHYPVPLHLTRPFLAQGHKRGDFPIAEGTSKRLLSLPMFPELKQTEIKYIAATIHEFFRLKKSSRP